MARGAIVDIRGEPISGSAEGRPEIGVEYAGIGMGRDITRGYIAETHYLYPLDKVLRYQGAHNYELYEDMLQDDRIYSTFAQRRSAVIAREWTVHPGGATRRDVMAADALREQLDHVRWNTVTNMMLYGIFYGYSVAEVMWARDGQHVAMDAIRVRNRRRFVFDETYRPLLLTVGQAYGGRVPDRKFWHFSTGADHDDEPYGRGLAYYLYWPVWFKKNHVRFWLTYEEKYAAPTAVGKYRRNAGPDEIRRLLNAVRALQADTGIAIPEEMVIELLEAQRTGGGHYDTFYDKMQEAITTIVLSQTMTTTDGSSLSQAQVHLNVRDEVIVTDSMLIDDSFSRSVATWLTEWNFPGAVTPMVQRIIRRPESLKALADRDKIIFDMGHRLTRDYVMQAYDVEVEDPPPPTRGAEFAESGTPDAADVLADRLEDAAGAALDGLVEPVRRLVEQAESLEAIRDGLLELYAGMDASELGVLMQRALMAAELAGRYDAAEGD